MRSLALLVPAPRRAALTPAALRRRSQAMEPFFSVLLSWAFMGSVPSIPMLVTLAPIVGGVALASMSARARPQHCLGWRALAPWLAR